MWIAWKSCNVSSVVKITKENRICSATSAGHTVRLEQKMTLNVSSVTRSIQEKGISTDILNPHINTYFWFFVYFSPFISQRFLVWKYMFIIVSVLFSICYSWSIWVAFAIYWVIIDIPDFWAIFSWFWQFLEVFFGFGALLMQLGKCWTLNLALHTHLKTTFCHIPAKSWVSWLVHPSKRKPYFILLDKE